MKNLCCHCKKKVAGEAREVSFSHQGLAVKLFKSGAECVDCCKKNWIEEFDAYSPELINLRTGKVNWRVFAETLKISQEKTTKIVSILLSIGVFSFEVKENWEIMASIGSLGLNPKSYSSLEVYFTKEEDAIEFAYLVYGGTFYPWTIRHTDRIISKEEVLRRFEEKKA